MDQVAQVYFNQRLVGTLARNNRSYVFQYDKFFLAADDSFPISYNFPLREKEYVSNKLFPFFEGLVSEGWLLKLQSQSLKIDEKDCFSMLLENGEDLVGGIRIKK